MKPLSQKLRIFSIFNALFLAITLCSSVAHGEETAKFKEIEKDDAFSVRVYEPLVLVSVALDNPEGKSNKSFMKLFKYISKGNDKRQKIAMTTPVFVDKGKEKKEMYFVMPATHVKEGSPAPLDKSLKITKQAEKVFAVYTYKGGSTKVANDAGEKKLRDWLVKKKLKIIGEPIVASYDSPFKPRFLHKNEVIVEIEPSAELKKKAQK